MSLLNDVLKDLDARQAVAAGDKPLPSAVRPLPALRHARPSWQLVALLAGGLAVAVGGAVALYLPVGKVAEPVSAPAAANPPAPSVPSEPAAAPVVAATDDVATPASVAGAATTAAAPANAAALPAPSAVGAPDGVAAHDAPTAAPAAKAGAAQPVKAPERSRAGSAPAVVPRTAAAPATEPATARSAEGSDKTPRADKARAATPEEKPEAHPKAAIERSDANVAGERVDVEYRKAVNALNQGRVAEAIEGLRGVLRGDPLQRAARQLLVKLLIEAGRADEAIDVLRDGVRGQPAQIGWAMALARLQIDRGDLPAAWATLDASLPAAANSADYQGFAGNVLQRLGRSREAIARFQAATRLAPGDGRWWLGLGMAHDAEGETDAARTAFLNARQAGNLTPELLALLERKLRQ